MRFILSVPGVRTTIGGTSKMVHLQAYLHTTENFEPLDADLVAQVLEFHRKWMG